MRCNVAEVVTVLEAAVPRYFFHHHVNEQVLVDDIGTVLADDAAARNEAKQALAEIGREEIPADGNQIEMWIEVTDEAGRVLFDVHLDFRLDEKPRR